MKKRIIFILIIIAITISLNISNLLSFNFRNSGNLNNSIKSNNSSSWIKNWDNPYRITKKLVTDTSENVYCAGVIDYSDPNYIGPPEIVSIFISKINSSGIENWTLFLDYNYSFGDFEIDMDNNTYSLWNMPNDLSMLLKVNNAGSLLWNCSFKGNLYDIYIDNYKNIHLMGYDYIHSERFLKLVKLNSSGTMLYNYSFLIDADPFCMRLDDLNNTYIALFDYDLQDICLYRVNSSSELTLENQIDEEPNLMRLLFDDVGNLYVFGIDNSNFNLLFKYNNSGYNIFNATWKSYSPFIYESFWEHITISKSGDILCAGETNYYTLTAFSEIFLVIFDEDGTFKGDYVWRKYHDCYLTALQLDRNDNIYFAGNSEVGPFIVKNPSLDNFSIKIFNLYFNEEIISTFLLVIIFFGIWGLAGISLYIFYLRKKKRK